MKTKIILIFLLALAPFSSEASCRAHWKSAKDYRDRANNYVKALGIIGSVSTTSVGAWPIGLGFVAVSGTIYGINKLLDRMGRIYELLDEADVCSGRRITKFYHRYKPRVATPMSRHEFCAALVEMDKQELLCGDHIPPSKHRILLTLIHGPEKAD